MIGNLTAMPVLVRAVGASRQDLPHSAVRGIPQGGMMPSDMIACLSSPYDN